jgi:hypothetical protein
VHTHPPSLPPVNRKARWPFLILAAVSVFLLTYLLIPMWLGDDIYLSLLIPHFRWLILALIALCGLIALRCYWLDRRQTCTNPNSQLQSGLNPNTERLRKLSFSAISQFLVPQAWSIELIQKLNPKQFTQMCIAYYEIKGIAHSTLTLGSAAGVNILIWNNDIVNRVIHCSNDQIVEMTALRQFLGVMMHERAPAGVYIHRGSFSEEVRIFAASHHIQLRNEYALLAKIEKLSERRQQQLLKMTLH